MRHFSISKTELQKVFDGESLLSQPNHSLEKRPKKPKNQSKNREHLSEEPLGIESENFPVHRGVASTSLKTTSHHKLKSVHTVLSSRIESESFELLDLDDNVDEFDDSPKKRPMSDLDDKDKKNSSPKNNRRQSSPRGRRNIIAEPENYTYQRLLIYSDGAARGNPGESGAGVVLKTPEGEEVGRFGKYLGKKTNNYAEYQAVLLGLNHAREFGASEITILSDSELLVRQLSGEYRVRAIHLRELFEQVKDLLGLFEKYQVKRIGREKNSEADSMANRAIDEKL